MATVPLNINKKFICPGDIIRTTINSVINLTGKTVTDVVIVATVPKGVEFYQANLSQGTYNPLENKWYIGTMVKNSRVSGEIAWKVIDDCQAPFNFAFTSASEGDNICFNSDADKIACINIDGLTSCDVNGFKPIKTITTAYTPQIKDYTIEVDASDQIIDITLPPPQDTYKYIKKAGTEWYIKVIDLTNPVKIIATPYKIVDHSNVEDAGTEFSFTVEGQTVAIQSNGQYYIIRQV